MRRNCVLVFAIVVVLTPASSQLPVTDQPPIRDISFFTSLGVLQLASVGFLVQLSDQSSLGIVTSAVILKGHGLPNGTLGLGARWSHYFSRDGKNKFLWANAIVMDAQYLFPTRNAPTLSMKSPGGVGIEAVVGRDGIVGPGLGILWGFGLAATFHSQERPLITPALRLGLHVDI